MASTNYLLTEEQLLCCICLDVFTDPVTLLCGHNFCKHCITQHLSFNSQRRCPMCKEQVDGKHRLGVNTFISEMAVQFRRSAGRRGGGAEQQDAAPQKHCVHVPSPPRKNELQRACFLLALGLVCLALLAGAFHTRHLLLGLFGAGRAGGVCSRHDRPLELYCRNEQTPVCRACAESTHRFHHVVALEEEFDAARAELGKSEADLQQRIRERELKVEELQRSAELSRETAVSEKERGAGVFSALIRAMEAAQAELLRTIQHKQEAKEKQVRGLIEELLLEISVLSRRRVKVEQLSRAKDPLLLFQDLPSLNTEPSTKDWADVSVCPEFYEGVMRTALVNAVNQLTETVAREMKSQQEAEVQRAERYAVDVTLDPDAAHPALVLSEDGKRVHCGDVRHKLPDDAKRFLLALSVVAKQSFSCGRFHYDVRVEGKTTWTLGVARHSVSRTGRTTLKPENGYWTLQLQNRTLYALETRPVPLSVDAPPEQVKVFVSYEEGVVSFYDVDAAALLYSFKGCAFTERLHPFFSPGASDGGRNAAPLVIAPVQ
ncbi:zinc finger protein RFP-like [Betta splendens]|uniref:Zinc finger protein RFP-like n=1 Tax=Betta splendens TaxID=158456 RepID=A0A9W2Y2M4_BETSP|nr:zinc finger protein RFP-like [Betta splendens]XP_055368089.1 zinc finger protein RFP-like [Betta splendens]XP_055368090.1 zinc finger protein RFP-like [Betta splendens]